MRFWSALAVQLLAIVLRDQSKSTLVSSPVIDVCDCLCKCETPEPRPREASFGILYICSWISSFDHLRSLVVEVAWFC